MPEVAYQLVRYVDDWFPGWVEAHLTDHAGRTWTFVDKQTQFTLEPSSAKCSLATATSGSPPRNTSTAGTNSCTAPDT